MVRNRIIPCLLIQNENLVKTTRFKNPRYIGDIINTVRIFNELEVDELILLDIIATTSSLKPNFELLEDLANECFMPLAYGGGINNVKDAKRIIELGFEKIVVNSSNFIDEYLISSIASELGSQSVVGAIDVKKDFFGNYKVYSESATKKHNISPSEWAIQLVKRGVGELIVTSVDNEGTWKGMDLKLIESVANSVNVPIICHGGAGKTDDIKDLFDKGINAVGLGNMVVYQKKDMGVLINFPK